jgi:tRNA-dihydrouridine synthase
MAFSPFITTLKSFTISAKHIKDILPENNHAMPLIPQILSKDTDGFIRLSKRLFDLGYKDINWNLGCPYPMVAKKMRGSGLLPYPELIDQFLDKVLSAIPNQLSIKTRIGRFCEDEIMSVMPVFNQYPLSTIIIHPRTGKQMYDGIPNLECFNICLKKSRHPVIYNGDIRSINDYQLLKKNFPEVMGWMIGRGILSNPFLPEIIKNGPVNKKTHHIFKQFHDDLFEKYMSHLNGPGHVLGKMKGHWQYMSQRFVNGHKLLKKIQRVSSLNHYKSIIKQAIQDCSEKDFLWKNVNIQESNQL